METEASEIIGLGEWKVTELRLRIATVIGRLRSEIYLFVEASDLKKQRPQ